MLGSVIALAAMLASPAAFTQTTEPESTELETVEVTGSRIKRVDLEGPLPITVITREQLDAAGDLTVSDFLRTMPFNSFGSFQPISISGGGGGTQASLSLRGIGSARTLVLVDGRRLPASPAFSGAAQNLNTIPLAVVDRIEVLREGASAVYGSDAIGGVVNIITKKDFQGGVVTGQADRPSSEGNDSANANIVTGLTSSQGNFYIALDHAQRDIIFTRDRPYLIDPDTNPPSPTGFPGSFRRRNMNFGALGSTTSGVTNTLEGFFADPACPAAFDTDPLFPNSRVQNFGGALGQRCAFRFASTAGEQPEQDRDTLLASGNLKLTDSLNFFSRMSFTRLASFNNLAPSPAPTANRVLSGDDPLNPTFNEIRDDNNDGVADAPAADGDGDGRPDNAGYTIDYAFRFVPLGTRDVDVRDDVQQLLFGLNGDFAWMDGATWEAAYFDNRYKQDVEQKNLFLFSEFLAAVADGSLNPFDITTFETTAARVRHTGIVAQETTSRGVDGSLNLGVLPLPFRVSAVVGMEYREDAYFTRPDGQSQFGNVVGSSGGNAAGGDRDYNALYAEASSMFLDDMLEVAFALRRDDYSDFGSEVSPKLSLALRPMDQLLVRASVGSGFRAPDLETLYSTAIQSFEFINDTLICNQTGSGCAGVDPTFQQETAFTSNPDLGAETSDQFTAGVVFNATQDLSISLDYYSIEVKDGIGNLTAQDIMDLEAQCHAQARPCNPSQEGLVIRETGSTTQFGINGDLTDLDSNPATPDVFVPTPIVLIVAPAANFAKIETDGIDIDVNYALSTTVGRFGFSANISHVLSFKDQDSPFGSLIEQTEARGVPDTRATLGANWSLNAFSAGLGFNHIADTLDCSANDRESGSAACDTGGVDAYNTIDAQFGYQTPWKGALVIGVRNLTDEDPPLSANAGGYDETLYDIFGRVPYVRVTQSF